MRMKKMASVALAVTLVLLTAACGQKNAQPVGAPASASTAAPEQTKGKLVLGTSADYPPYEFHKSINGKDTVVGFDIEIAKEVANEMGKELEVKDMKFDGLLAALVAGNVDMVMAGMTPTPERQQNADFSKIYYTAEQLIVVRGEDKEKFKSLDDLAGKKIGVQKGSIQEEVAQTEIKNANLVSLGKIGDIVLQLKTKKVDAILLEMPIADFYTEQHKDLAVSGIKLSAGDAGSAVALKKGNAELLAAVNKVLDRLIAEKKIDQYVKDAVAASKELME